MRLPDTFVEQYKHVTPNWGFDGLGYVIYKRTYARYLPDEGRTEDWYETVRRVVEGNFSIDVGTGEDPTATVEEAERLYHAIFNFAILLSGRNLWMGGTPYLKRIADAAQNCFAGETLLHTDKGLVPLADLAGLTVNVLSQDGVYRPAEVRNFGKQSLMRVQLGNGDVIFATPEHEWLKIGGADSSKLTRVFTRDLAVGDQIPINRPNTPAELDLEGFAHGFVFGDGHLGDGGWSSVMLFGEKVQLQELLLQFGRKSASEIPTVTRMPHDWKKLPIGPSREYAYSFVMGLLAADGYCRDREARLFNRDYATMVAIRNLAFWGGLLTGPTTLMDDRSPYTGGPRTLYELRLKAWTINPEHILRKDQRERFTKGAPRMPRHPYTAVKSVEISDRFEEVFCAVEPETHTITIGSGLLTGNCWGIAVKPNGYELPDVNLFSVPFPELTARPSFPFAFTADQLMKGGGVGAAVGQEHLALFPDVKHAVDLRFACTKWHPNVADLGELAPAGHRVVIDDSREGWYEAIATLVDAHFVEGWDKFTFDVSEIRPYGERIEGFGGKAAGPGPLVDCLRAMNDVLNARAGQRLRPIDAGDMIQLIGRCVVAGNVRRSALLLLGDSDDEAFLASKDYEHLENPAASQWRWASNNSLIWDETTDLRALAERVYQNGEPGLINLELSRNAGRLHDGLQPGVDGLVITTNPCGEETLESGEPCNLAEVNPVGCDIIGFSIEEALYLATRYSYRITFLPFEWAISREVIERNRRIGVSLTGLQDWFLLRFGRSPIAGWLGLEPLWDREISDTVDHYYQIVKETNENHARALRAAPSIKVTTNKPSGTVSLLGGVAPGIHAHWAPYMIRRVQFGADDPLLGMLQSAGYPIESRIMGRDAEGRKQYDGRTKVVEFPVKAPSAEALGFRSAGEWSLAEQLALEAFMQEFWADAAVSTTAYFHRAPGFNDELREEDAPALDELVTVLEAFRSRLKSTALLPYATGTYEQMPYEEITAAEYERRRAALRPVQWGRNVDVVRSSITEDVLNQVECDQNGCPIR